MNKQSKFKSICEATYNNAGYIEAFALGKEEVMVDRTKWPNGKIPLLVARNRTGRGSVSIILPASMTKLTIKNISKTNDIKKLKEREYTVNGIKPIIVIVKNQMFIFKPKELIYENPVQSTKMDMAIKIFFGRNGIRAVYKQQQNGVWQPYPLLRPSIADKENLQLWREYMLTMKTYFPDEKVFSSVGVMKPIVKSKPVSFAPEDDASEEIDPYGRVESPTDEEDWIRNILKNR